MTEGAETGPAKAGPAPADAFTRAALRATLEEGVRAGVRFVSFDEAAVADEPACLLRHDVDGDLGAAVVIAELEVALGIRSTFFLMLRSPLYNLLGRANVRLAQRLPHLGHWVGLHYDNGFRPDERPAEEWVRRETRILEELLDAPVRAFSFHQPPADVFERPPLRVEGLVNVYDREALRGYEYVSDSNMIWRSPPPIERFRRRDFRRLQILLHPMWWVHEGAPATPRDAWDAAAVANWERGQDELVATEAAYGPRRRIEVRRP